MLTPCPPCQYKIQSWLTWCRSSWLSFSHFRFLFNFFLLSCREFLQSGRFDGGAPNSTNQGELSLSRKILSSFGQKNNKTKHKYLSQTLKVAQHMLCKRVHLYSASFKSLSLRPALGMFCFFKSVVFNPTDCLHCSLWKKKNPKISPPPKKKSLPTEILFMYSQCNKNSNENGTSTERIERDVAAAAEFVRTLFWTSGRITTGSSAWGQETKKTH